MADQPSPFKAALWMAGSIASFLLTTVAGRELTEALNVFLVLELRSIIGFLILLPLVMARGGLTAMRTGRPLMHLGRNVAHYVGQGAWLYGLTLISIAELIAIEFTTPIWTAILAVAFLRETLSPARLASIALGLVGVLIIVRPSSGTVDPGHLVVLFAALAFGISLVMMKSLTATDSTTRIIFWMLVIQSVLGLLPALHAWQAPPPELWGWIVIIGFSGMSSHFCLARALSHADATFVAPLDFARVPLSAALGWALYNEHIDLYTAGGALLILAGNLLNVQRRGLKPAR